MARVAVRAAFAVYGATLAVALSAALQAPARPDALPSGITALGSDPAGPLRQFVFVIVVTFLFAASALGVMRFVIERRWAMVTSSICLISAPVTLMHFGNTRHVLMHGAAAGVVVLLRRWNPRFSAADVVLLPAGLAFYFAFLDLGFGHTPAAAVLRAAAATLALRLMVGAWSAFARPAYAFAAAPLAFVVQSQWLAPRPAGAIALLWLVGTPLVLARVAGEASLKRFAVRIAYPIAVAAYGLALLSITQPIHVDFFEDGHDLQPANEFVRGKVPYRDIVPIHGLVSDGGLAWIVMRLGGDSAGAVLKTRLVLASLTVAAIYFVTLAATGSGEAALLAVFLAYSLLPPETIWFRALFPLLTLAFTVSSVRLRNSRWLIPAGVALVLSALMSLDLAAVSAMVLFVAVIRSDDRVRSLRRVATGVAAAALPLVIVFAAGGFLVDALRVTFTEVLRARSVYVFAPLTVPASLRSLTALVSLLTDRSSFCFVVWAVALIGCAAVFGDAPLRARRRDAVWLIALWIVVAGISYVERRHLYFAFAVAAFLTSLIFRMLRGRLRQAAIVLTIVLVLIAAPFEHVFNVATPLRRSHGVPVGDAQPFAGSRRAAGAVFDPATAAALGSTERFLSTLSAGATFFDFANAGLLFYLFDRETPVRFNSVPMFESQAAQREVIDALERRRVAAALIAFPSALSNIDGVPNSVRAPLVWKYLQAHYAPAFEENGVVFWRRIQ